MEWKALVHLCSSVFICGSTLLLGCRPVQPPKVQGYYGATEKIEAVVEKVNQNNVGIPTLWTQGDFEAWVRDDHGKEHFINGDASLMYRKARDLRMIGKKPGIGPVFDVGSNNDRYWLRVGADVDTLWWGDYANASGPSIRDMPVRPDLLLQVLGVGTIDTNLLEQPVPVMRFNNDADAYMLVWTVRTATNWVALKEIWYDRQTFLPRLVLLFDGNGRIVVRAYLSAHKPVEESGAMLATKYQLYFPETSTKLNLSLNEVKLSSKGFPRDGSFAFPGEGAASKVIFIDAPATP